jgi:dihydroxyacetone kinase DhaKLM complex PTS-EIIA-like component DhaM
MHGLRKFEVIWPSGKRDYELGTSPEAVRERLQRQWSPIDVSRLEIVPVIELQDPKTRMRRNVVL